MGHHRHVQEWHPHPEDGVSEVDGHAPHVAELREDGWGTVDQLNEYMCNTSNMNTQTQLYSLCPSHATHIRDKTMDMALGPPSPPSPPPGPSPPPTTDVMLMIM